MENERITADEIKEMFQLQWLEGEGGLFTSSYRSEVRLPSGRAIGTGIYAMFTDKPDCFSAMHRLDADETWHFYLGDPLEMLLLFPDRSHSEVTLGQDIPRVIDCSTTCQRELGWVHHCGAAGVTR